MPKKSALLCLTPQVREAIELHIDGMSCPAIAKKLGVHETTVRRWFYREDVLEEYRKIVKKQNLFDVAAARRNLRRDLDTEKKGEAYLRQNATFFVLNRYEDEVMGENEGSFTITFANGKPDLGMPDPTDDDK